MKQLFNEETLRAFISNIIERINGQEGREKFELNTTQGYFSIRVKGRKRNTNVVCFVKNEPVLSISKLAGIKKSLFDKPPFNELKMRSRPPRALQLRPDNWGLYPHNLEYNFNEDREIVFQLCRNACEKFPV